MTYGPIMVKYSEFDPLFRISDPPKTLVMDLSWVLQLKHVSFLAFISIFDCDKVDIDTKLPFQVCNPT